MYSQDSKDKALGMLRLTGDVEKTARMSGVPGRTLRRWAAAAAKPRRGPAGPSSSPTAARSGARRWRWLGRRVLQGNRGGARHREPRCCTLLAERRRNEGGADGRSGKDT